MFISLVYFLLLLMQDPLDENDLRYCYEGSSQGFSVLPTFGTTFMTVGTVFEGLDRCPGEGPSASLPLRGFVLSNVS